MNTIVCASCEASIPENSTFCLQCGMRVKCYSCDSILARNAKFCSNCGTSVTNIIEGNEKNTFEYHKKNDEVFCKVSLTNEVGKDSIQGLIEGLTNPNGVIKDNKRLRDVSKNPLNDNAFDEAEEVLDDNNINSNDIYPHINDVELTVDCSESEWIAIYAFYISDYAKKTFSKKTVHERYMLKRKTDSNASNFSKNWISALKTYFSTINDNELKFKSNNIDHIKNLITGKEKGIVRNLQKRKATKKDDKISQPVEKKNSSSKARSKSSSGNNYKLVTDLNLIPKGSESLKDFYGKYNAKNTAEIFLVIVYYMQKILKTSNIDSDKIYTCYKELGLQVPMIKTALDNINRRNGFIDSNNRSDLKITLSGENHIEHKMEKKSGK